MSNKSHVALLDCLCPVCTTVVESNILLDKQLQQSLDPKYQQWSDSLCPQCAEERKEFVHMVEISNQAQAYTTHLKKEDAVRTGRTVKLRIPVFNDLFGHTPKEPYVFCDAQLIDALLKMSGQTEPS